MNNNKILKLDPKDKNYTVSCGEGLYVMVRTSGKKSWLMRWSENRTKHKKIIGDATLLPLDEARKKVIELKKKLALGLTIRKEKQEKIYIFKDFYVKAIREKGSRSDDTSKKAIQLIDKKVINHIGLKQIKDINPEAIIKIISEIHDSGTKVTAVKVFYELKSIFSYFVINKYIKYNPMIDINTNTIFKGIEENFRRTITDMESVRSLLDEIKIDDTSSIDISNALTVLIYTALRPMEVRLLKWENIDFDKRIITLKSSDTKKKKDHIIYITDTVYNILFDMLSINGDNDYVFHGSRGLNTPFSNAAMGLLIKKIGYSKNITPYSIRACFGTISNKESGFDSIIIDYQLGISTKSTASQGNNRNDYFEHRIKLMQWWDAELKGQIK